MPDETSEQKVQATEPEEAKVQPEVDAQPKEQEEGLPDDASERTKREFDKLKKHNEELSKKLAEKEAGMPPKPSLLDQYIPQVPAPPVPPVATHLPQEQVQEITKQLWDEEGQIDGNELQRRLSLADQAEARAKKAEAKAQAAMERIARFEVEGQKKVLYEKYPELDPSNKEAFKEEAYDLVRNEMVNQLWATGKQDPMSAAAKMSKYWRQQQPQQQNEAIEARKAVQTPASGRASKSFGDYEQLRKQSLRSKEAMEERIRRAGI